MSAKPDRPQWSNLPESKRHHYNALGLNGNWYNSSRSASDTGRIALPFVGVNVQTGQAGFYRLTNLTAHEESAAGEQAVRIRDYLAFGIGPSSNLDGRRVRGIDPETGQPVTIVLTTDEATLLYLAATDQLDYELFYLPV